MGLQESFPLTSAFFSRTDLFVKRVSRVKLGAALLCLAAAIYFLGPTLLFVESEQAMTNAPIVTLRTAIPGSVQEIDVETGAKIERGVQIATIRNDHWDPSRLLETAQSLQAATSRAAAARTEAESLRVERARLQKDYALWLSSATKAAEHELDAGRAHLTSADAQLFSAQKQLDRYQKLKSLDFVSKQRMDEVERDRAVADGQYDAALHEVGRLEQKVAALHGGITLNENDRPPTLQRLDEIEMRLGTLAATAAQGDQDAATLKSQVSERQAEKTRETGSAITAPVNGTVWQLFVGTGDQIAAETAVANIIDCARTDVTAIFRQRNVGSLSVGRRATVEIVGIDTPLQGHVAAVNGYYEADDRLAEAIKMKPLDQSSVIARIDLDQPVPGCLIGLKGKATLSWW